MPRSVPWTEVLARAEAFLEAGFREIVVTGCNLALYRSGGHGLADLLAALADLQTDGPHRVRLGSLEPGICDDDLLNVMERHRNICRFIHLSLQSASPAVLKRMNRPYTIERAASFCAEAQKRLGPRLSLGADIICGFPGESEEDFAMTRSFLSGNHSLAQEVKFTNLHVFPYSERPGTPAATMDGKVPVSVRRYRAKELETLGRIQREAFAKTFVGKSVQVCVERGDDHGWTDEYLPCRLSIPAPRRSLKTVYVTGCSEEILSASRKGHE